ncbi:MAG: PAS domain-containing sensor histidine kinase [Methanobacterium sp.]
MRDNAERELQKAKKKETVPESNSKLVHELQVHQVELEMQNEELKEAQEELAKLLDEFHEFYDEAPVGYFLLDKNGNVKNVNIKGVELLGLDKGMIVGFGFVRFIPLNYQTKYYRSLKDAMVKCNVEEVELQLKREKSLFYVQMQIVPIYDKFDEKYRITITDITERKKAEEELLQNHDIFNAIIEDAEGPIFSVDCNYRYTSFNLLHAKVMKTLFNADIKIGNNILDYHTNPDDRENAKLNIDKALDGEVVKIESYAGDNLQNYRYFSIFHSPIKDSNGKVIGAAVYAHDITERKKAEEKLKQAHDNLEEQVKERTRELYNERQRLFDVLETMPIMICLLRPDYHVAFANRAFREKFGESGGRHCYEYCFGYSEPCEFCESFKPLETGEPHYWQVKSPDGSIIDSYDFPFTDTDGSPLILEMDIDVTEQKQAEEALKSTLRELERYNEELQSFAYITSHDLQEPLRSIASYAQLIERRYKGQLDSDADEFLDYMVGGATRLQGMIKGLLEYSRVGTKGGEFKDFNAEEALNHALSNLKSSIDECHVEVIYDHLPVIHADENQISRVFQNLIGNALKFRKKDIQPKIHISTQTDDEYIFSIADNGIGIEEQYKDRIFEVFKRLHPIGEYDGAGIGLAIVKKIVERHGGRIWVESEFGVGSTFYFALPVKSQE